MRGLQSYSTSVVHMLIDFRAHSIQNAHSFPRYSTTLCLANIHGCLLCLKNCPSAFSSQSSGLHLAVARSNWIPPVWRSSLNRASHVNYINVNIPCKAQVPEPLGQLPQAVTSKRNTFPRSSQPWTITASKYLGHWNASRYCLTWPLSPTRKWQVERCFFAFSTRSFFADPNLFEWNMK